MSQTSTSHTLCQSGLLIMNRSCWKQTLTYKLHLHSFSSSSLSWETEYLLESEEKELYWRWSLKLQQMQYGHFFGLCHSKLYSFLLFTHRRNSLKFTQILLVPLATLCLALFLMFFRLEMIASSPVGFCLLDWPLPAFTKELILIPTFVYSYILQH